jgi:hypothetical protein
MERDTTRSLAGEYSIAVFVRPSKLAIRFVHLENVLMSATNERMCNTSIRCRHAAKTGTCYRHAGHSQKLLPIIDNLSKLDFTPGPWEEVRTRVQTMEDSFQAVLMQLAPDSSQRAVVCALLDVSRAALSAHNDLFANHRRLCVSSLSLRE